MYNSGCLKPSMKHGGGSVMVWTYMMYKSDIESDRQKKTTKCKPHI